MKHAHNSSRFGYQAYFWLWGTMGVSQCLTERKDVKLISYIRAHQIIQVHFFSYTVQADWYHQDKPYVYLDFSLMILIFAGI